MYGALLSGKNAALYSMPTTAINSPLIREDSQVFI